MQDKIIGVVIHHSASGDVSANTINRWHLEREWNQIGYHFVIRENGEIEPGRQWDRNGAHKRGYNDSHLGICLTGEFNKYTPTVEQMQSLIKLVKGIDNRFSIQEVIKHHENCPGKLFPWKYFKQNLNL